MSEASQDSLEDDEFLRAFESCTFPPENFHHRDHIRLAWLYLVRYGEQEAQRRVSVAIRKYTGQHGASGKYHETMTNAWLRLIAHATSHMPANCGFETLAAHFPQILDKNALTKHYSDALLSSSLARAVWVEPDLLPLP